MPSLMDLPRELRDKICTQVLLTSVIPPDINQPFEALTENRVQFKNPKLQAWSKVVLYDPQNSTARAPSLLLVNKQLHHETLSTLRLLSKHPIYEMDLIIANELVLLPTWTYAPSTHSKPLEAVNVTFRIAGVYDNTKDYAYRFYMGFRGADGGGPAMGWQLYAVLERFIRAGAGGETEHADTHLHVTAKCLRIDVRTPPGIEEARFGLPLSGTMLGRHRRTGSDVLDPAYLVRFVSQHIRGLLKAYSLEWFQYGKVLYEHVDEVVVCRDGVEVNRWDVAECLEPREVEDRYFSREQMRQYKEDTWQIRKLRGLRVVHD